MSNLKTKYLTTKQLHNLTGLSASFFEKGRLHQYGPPYFKVRGKVLYNSLDVQNWIEANRINPEGSVNDR